MSSRLACSVALLLSVCSGARAQFTCFGIPDSDPTVCSGHGTCIAENTCSCNEGWYGVQCDLPFICFGLPSYDPDVCSGHGSCIAENTCGCETGYTGGECEFAVCFFVASNDPSVCSGHGACVGPDECQCEAGWGGPDCSADVSGVPTMSTWGLTIMLLALVVAGSVVIIRRPRVAV